MRNQRQDVVAKSILDLHIKNGKIFSAYRFVGPKFSGKFEMAGVFAAATGRDTLVYDAAKGNADDFRQVVALSKLKSQGGQIFVVNNANQLNQASFSGLLKAIEEVGANKIFILIDHADSLPSTIISRCITVRFARHGYFFSDDTPEPGPLFAEPSASRSQRLLWAMEEVESSLGELQNRLLCWINMARSKYADNPRRWISRIILLNEAFKSLDANANKKMVLEQLAYKW